MASTEAIPAKRWGRIIPPAILVYIFGFMDRTNIGFAMAGGMSDALQMTATLSGLAAGIFFIGYMVLQVPGGHIAETGNAKKFIAGFYSCLECDLYQPWVCTDFDPAFSPALPRRRG